jgi:2',3'-cyclic-nucleotide 2'-phosphodiesterase (5'-nucleotidase family)
VRYIPLTLLHTNDLHGHVYLPGQARGLTKIATLVRRIRAEMPNVLLLDAGDIIHGTPEEKAFGGQPSISAMNALGYDAATAGNHEFGFGQDVLRDAIRFARFPVLSANVLDERTGQAWGGLIPYIVREVDGARVAIFGLTTLETIKFEWPRTLAGIRFADPVETARALVPRLREDERADVVIALSHLGALPDGLLAAAVPGIDVVLGGHSHTRLAEQVWVGDTLILQTGAHGHALGRVDLIVRKGADGQGRVSLINGRPSPARRGGRWWGHNGVRAPLGRTYPAGSLLPLTEAVPDDPAVLAVYRPFADRLRPVLDEVLTTAAEPLPASEVLRCETALGSLLADAVREQAKTDVAVAAGSQINAQGLGAGPVRVRDLYTLLGAYTRQHLVVARVPGARLREVLARALEGGQVRLHVSGLRVGEEIIVGGAPLDDAKTYTVAGAAHILQEYLLGREGVEILADDTQAPTVRDAAIAFLRGHAPLRNATDGRLPPATQTNAG